jgi:hypothetical protein
MASPQSHGFFREDLDKVKKAVTLGFKRQNSGVSRINIEPPVA